MHTVVVARHISHLRKSCPHGAVGLVHAASHLAAGVKTVAKCGQMLVAFHTFRFPLFGNFVAHAPHNDAGVVAVVQNQVGDVFLPPFVPQFAVAVAHFWFFPTVETLSHHHHAHTVAHLHLHGRWHVVAGANGIGTHILHDADLANDGGFVHGCAKRTEVVVQTHAFDFAGHAIELETAFGTEFHGANAQFLMLHIERFAIGYERKFHIVEVWRFGRPKLWVGNAHLRMEAAHAVGWR